MVQTANRAQHENVIEFVGLSLPSCKYKIESSFEHPRVMASEIFVDNEFGSGSTDQKGDRFSESTTIN